MLKQYENQFWKKGTGYSQIFIQWVTEDIAGLDDMFFIPVDWKIRELM